MASPQNIEEKADKKMIRGSFAVSLFIHALVLLIIGSIVIVPGAVQKLLPVASVPTTPVDIPQPPKMEETAPVDQSLDPGGSPISDQPQDAVPTPDTAKADALVLDTPSSMGPRMDASPGASATIASDVFKQGGQGRTGGGTGTSNGSPAGIGLGKATLFGHTEKIDNSLIGKIYDFKQNRYKQPIKFNVVENIKTIVNSGFSHGELSKYFSPTNTLYATHLYIPGIKAEEGPKAFGVEDIIKPVNFMVHYQASIAAPNDMSFRFVGYGDDWLVVAINHKVVLDGSYVSVCRSPPPAPATFSKTLFSWNPPPDYCDRKSLLGGRGEWLDWKAGEFKTIDILISETGGNASAYDLYIQEKGHDAVELFRVANVDPGIKVQQGKPPIPLGPIFKAKHLSP